MPFGEVMRGEGTGPRVKFTGKERDAETGLDYFGARYFSGAQGRFTSADRPFADQHSEDPQSWNLYAYGRNNPLLYVDPTGEAIELLGDEEARKKELALLQSSVGNKQAASRLYINEVKDGDKTLYFVGIKGNVGDFMKLSDTAKDMANLVGHKNVVEFGLTSQNLANFGGAVTYGKGEAGNKNIRVLVNPDQMDITNRNLSPNTIVGMSRWEGQGVRPRSNVNDCIRRRSGRSIFVAGFAFTPRLVPVPDTARAGKRTAEAVPQMPNVSRADPLVDEGRDAFFIVVEEEGSETASLAEDEGQSREGRWGGR